MPCLNCKFIEMGEMACYEETCPQCGRVPSCRKKEVDKYNESLEILRKEVCTFLELGIIELMIVFVFSEDVSNDATPKF